MLAIKPDITRMTNILGYLKIAEIVNNLKINVFV